MKHKVACRGCGELFMPSFQHRVYCSDEHKALAELLDGEETKYRAAIGRVLKLQGTEHMLIEDLARHLPHPEPMFRNMPAAAPAIPDNIPGVRLEAALAQARAFNIQRRQDPLDWLRAMDPGPVQHVMPPLEARDEQRPLRFGEPAPFVPQAHPGLPLQPFIQPDFDPLDFDFDREDEGL